MGNGTTTFCWFLHYTQRYHMTQCFTPRYKYGRERAVFKCTDVHRSVADSPKWKLVKCATTDYSAMSHTTEHSLAVKKHCYIQWHG